MNRFCAALLLVTLSACGNDSVDQGPGGVSSEDAEALDEAAAKLDNQDASSAEQPGSQR